MDVVRGNDWKIYVPDTTILVTNPAAIAILSGNSDVLPYGERGFRELEWLITREQRIRKEPNDVVLPEMVLHELRGIQINDRKPSTVRSNSRLADRLLEHLLIENSSGAGPQQGYLFSGGVTLPNGARIHGIRHDEVAFQAWAKSLYEPNNDDRILFAIERLLKANPGLHDRVRFVSEDGEFRRKARETIVNGKHIFAEGFRFEEVQDPHQRYTGKIYVTIPQAKFHAFGVRERISIAETGLDPSLLFPNEVVILSPNAHPDQKLYFVNRASIPEGELDGLVNYQWVMQQLEEQPWSAAKVLAATGGKFNFSHHGDHTALIGALLQRQNLKKPERRKLKRLNGKFENEGQMQTYARMLANLENSKASPQEPNEEHERILYRKTNQDIIPFDEQIPYIDLLADDNIKALSAEASQGGGKTLLALLVGLLKVNAGVYNGITYIRPMKTVGEELGTLPGDKEAKISRFMMPIEDALQEIFRYHDSRSSKERDAILKQIGYLKANRYVNYEVAADIGGRTIRSQFILVDEAHLYTKAQVKMLMGRVGKGSKMTFIGDLNQLESYHNNEASARFLNPQTSGLAHLPERLRGKRPYAHFGMPDYLVKRSEVAALASEM